MPTVLVGLISHRTSEVSVRVTSQHADRIIYTSINNTIMVYLALTTIRTSLAALAYGPARIIFISPPRTFGS